MVEYDFLKNIFRNFVEIISSILFIKFDKSLKYQYVANLIRKLNCKVEKERERKWCENLEFLLPLFQENTLSSSLKYIYSGEEK